MKVTADRQPTCGAKTRLGSPCARAPVPDRRRCRLHGGLTPRGTASPHYKHGRYSKGLPADLAARYETALADPHLLELHDEIALIDARTEELLSHLSPDSNPERRSVDTAIWRQIRRNVEQRRRLVMSEVKRLILVRGFVPVEEAITLVRTLAEAVQQHVTDPVERAAVARALEAVVRRQAWEVQDQ